MYKSGSWVPKPPEEGSLVRVLAMWCKTLHVNSFINLASVYHVKDDSN